MKKEKETTPTSEPTLAQVMLDLSKSTDVFDLEFNECLIRVKDIPMVKLQRGIIKECGNNWLDDFNYYGFEEFIERNKINDAFTLASIIEFDTRK